MWNLLMYNVKILASNTTLLYQPVLSVFSYPVSLLIRTVYQEPVFSAECPVDLIISQS